MISNQQNQWQPGNEVTRQFSPAMDRPRCLHVKIGLREGVQHRSTRLAQNFVVTNRGTVAEQNRAKQALTPSISEQFCAPDALAWNLEVIALLLRLRRG